MQSILDKNLQLKDCMMTMEKYSNQIPTLYIAMKDLKLKIMDNLIYLPTDLPPQIQIKFQLD